jgi:hypothetical protein
MDAARTLVLDAAAGELASDLQRAELRSILLKGPTLARWLYDDDALRSYVDVDLLVPHDEVDAASKVLSASGFTLSLEEVSLPHGRRPHAETWVRASDGIMVDLHSTLPGLGVAPDAVWTVLAGDTGRMVVGGSEVEVLREPARALLVALHAAHHGVKDAQALDDLSRALDKVPEPTWREAAALAEQLDAVPALAAGLRLSPEGSRLAADLGLPVEASVETILRASSAPELALSLDWLMRAPGLRARARLIARKFAPPPCVMRARSRLARRGRVGFAAAYLVHPFGLAWRAGPALYAWLAARSRSRLG